MDFKKHLPILATAGFCLIAIVIFRVVLPFGHTFTSGGTQLNTVDAYSMIRYADTFPRILNYDYYINYPYGVDVQSNGLWPWLLGFLSDLFKTSTSDVGAILPPILFAMTLLPIYVISRLLFKDRYVPLVAMALFSILSGDVLDRTMVGAADYHCWEIFLFSYMMMFVFLSVRFYKDIRKMAVSAICAISFGALYALSWKGWPISLFIMGLFLLSLGMVKFGKLNKFLLFCGASVVVSALFIAFHAQFVRYLLQTVSLFTIVPNAMITEEYPLFFTAGQFDPHTIWNYFGITFYLMLVGLGMVIYRIVRYKRSGDSLFIVWLAVMLWLTLARRRFDYYFAANIAILSAYVVVFFVRYAIKRSRQYAVVLVLTFALVAVPLIRVDYVQASTYVNTMPQDWQETTKWLKDEVANSDITESLYRTGGVPISRGCYFNGMLFDPIIYAKEKSDLLNYGVLTWMDYGYWVIGVAHMPVMDTTGYRGSLVSRLFVSTDSDYVLSKVKELGFKYVIIDEDMVTTKAYNVFKSAHHAGDLTWEDVRVTFMYQLFYKGIDGYTPVFQSSDSKVKVFEVK